MGHKAIILATVMVFGTPALAVPAPTQTADNSSGTATGSGNTSAASPAQSDRTKYCVEVEAGTGSRLNITQCKTRAEWAREGIDVDQLKKD